MGLAQLLDSARASGPDVRVIALPAELQLPPDLLEHAYRVIQGGLTNAMKHAPGAPIDLRLTLNENGLLVDLRNGGVVHGSALAATGSGLGLKGMHERIEALSGSLAAGSDAGGGWYLRAWLPIAV